MKRMIWFTTISILFMLFIMPAIMASLIKMTPADDQPGYGPRRLVWPEKTFNLWH